MGYFQKILTIYFYKFREYSQLWYARNKTDYRFEIHETKSVLTDDPKLWNSLPYETRTASSVNMLKEAFLCFFLAKKYIIYRTDNGIM